MVRRLNSPGWVTFLGDDASRYPKIAISTHDVCPTVTQPGSDADDQRLFRVCHGRLILAAEGGEQ